MILREYWQGHRIFGSDEEDFLESEHYQNSCAFSLLQIGETVKRLPSELTSGYSDIEWRGITGLRDIIAHQYPNVSIHTIWKTITVKVPELKEHCVIILDRITQSMKE